MVQDANGQSSSALWEARRLRARDVTRSCHDDKPVAELGELRRYLMRLDPAIPDLLRIMARHPMTRGHLTQRRPLNSTPLRLSCALGASDLTGELARMDGREEGASGLRCGRRRITASVR